MGDQAQSPEGTTPNPTAAGGAATPPPATPAPTTTQAAPVTPAPASAAAPSAPATPAPTTVSTERVPTRKLLAEDEDIPDGVEILEIPRASFKGRLERASKKVLKEKFGTDNVEEILAWKTKAEESAKKEEEQRLAQMTESERLKEELTRERTAREQAERRYTQLEESRIIESEDRRVTGIMGEYFSPKYLKVHAPMLAAYLSGLPEGELVDDEKVIREWCAKEVEAEPWMRPGYVPASPVAATSTEATPPAPAKPPVPVPINNGGGVVRPDSQQQIVHKTAAPGRPNSMTEAEWRDYKRANNLSY